MNLIGYVGFVITRITEKPQRFEVYIEKFLQSIDYIRYSDATEDLYCFTHFYSYPEINNLKEGESLYVVGEWHGKWDYDGFNGEYYADFDLRNYEVSKPFVIENEDYDNYFDYMIFDDKPEVRGILEL